MSFMEPPACYYCEYPSPVGGTERRDGQHVCRLCLALRLPLAWRCGGQEQATLLGAICYVGNVIRADIAARGTDADRQ